MKFATWLKDNKEEAGILGAGLNSVHSFAAMGLNYRSLLDFIRFRTEKDMDVCRKAAEKPGTALTGIKFQAPIPQPHHDIMCLGLNYMDHAQEAIRFDIASDTKRDEAIYFSKRVVRVLGPDGVIENHFDLNGRLDYEAEMALVLGRDARNVKQDDAYNYIFGLATFNDISGRDLQTKHKQWYFGKSLDTFTAMGPWITTLDEFKLPLKVRVTSRVNGEARQDSDTSHLIFSPGYIIAELSAGLTLDAGSIIATGTPAGVGAGFNPPRCMKTGDVVEVEVEGCGVLRNTVG
jgi:2-keto-4-pentenoate hydratase/2-oxohepta-3-ene-1,7-dioic acid hydratase in catechol pathway